MALNESNARAEKQNTVMLPNEQRDFTAPLCKLDKTKRVLFLAHHRSIMHFFSRPAAQNGTLI